MIVLRYRRMNRTAFYRQAQAFLLALVSCLCSRAVLHAQTPNLKFERLSIVQGLSHSTVNCILQDRKGFMWFGTFDGLNRYDGHSFAVYKHHPEDSKSLGSNVIWSIYEDRSGGFWVGTDHGGLSKFDHATETFTRFQHDPADSNSLSSNRIRSIYEDRASRLWIATPDGGLNKLQIENSKGQKAITFTRYQHDPHNPNSLSDNTIWRIYEDEKEKDVLWIGTNKGLNKLVLSPANGGINSAEGLNQTKGTFTHYQHDPANPNSLSHDFVMSISADHEGTLWVGTNGGGLNKLDRQTETFTRYRHDADDPASLGGDLVYSIHADSHDDGTLWIGIWGGGLNKLQIENRNGQKATTFTRYQHDPANPNSLSGNYVLPIYEDRLGALWIGTNGGGVNRLDREKEDFALYQHDPDNPNSISDNGVSAIYEDRAGMLWIGTQTDGLNRLNRKTDAVTHYQHDPKNPRSLSGNIILAICEDRAVPQNGIWIGTFGRGLNRLVLSEAEGFDREKENFARYEHDPANPNSLSDNTVMVICESRSGGSNGAIWVGTANGLNRLDRNTGIFTRYKHEPENPNSLSDNYIVALYESRKNESGTTLWVGTNRGGLNKLVLEGPHHEKVTVTRYQHQPDNPNSLSSNRAFSIHEDRSVPQGGIWIGTWGGGLNRFDPKQEKFRRYRESDGLPNDVVYGILEDDLGNLWLSTNNGLSRFDPATETFRNYDIPDGLQGDEYNSGAFHRSALSGEMFFGGINGLNVFHPDHVKDNNFVPPVTITSLTRYNKNDAEGKPIFEKGISEKSEIALSYRDNILTFTFAALSYRNAFKNQYAYQPEGFNENWIALGTKHDVTFTNLDPGTYTLRVKGSNNDGVWNEEGASLKITIAPPWWKTWWAYALYVLLFTSLVYVARRYELNRINLKNRLRNEQVAAEKLREVDQMKSRFFANISHEFRTPLTLILGQIDSVLATIADRQNQGKLEVASRNARRLQRLINQLLDLSKLEAGSMALKAQRANLVSFLKSLVASFEHLAEQKGITLQFHSTHAEIALDYDPEKLEKVFYNLLSNAFKFTPEGGRVMVEIRRVEDGENRGMGEGEKRGEGESGNRRFSVSPFRPLPDSPPLRFPGSCVHVAIKDTGIGIPAEHLPHVFDRFYQADSSHQHEGTGIGLALAKELVELHRGEISVTSEVGKGSEFVVMLPLGSVISDRLSVISAAKGEERGAKSEERETKSIDSSLHQSSDPKIQQPTTPSIQSSIDPASQELVLLVEDNADIRAYVREQLESGYRVIEAADGEEGIAKAREAIPDLIITDVMMPKMDGYQLSRELKQDDKTSHIPIIMLTAKAALDDKIEGLEAGVDDYLLKPFSAKELLARVRNLIALRRQLRQRFSTATIIKPSEVTATSVDQAFIQRVIAAIEEHLGEEHFSVEDLATATNMSSSQLNRKLGALVDQPASQLIRSMRLQRAADLLKQNAGNVAEIAYQVGFSDHAHFARSFKKQFGCAPSEFRKNVENGDREKR